MKWALLSDIHANIQALLARMVDAGVQCLPVGVDVSKQGPFHRCLLVPRSSPGMLIASLREPGQAGLDGGQAWPFVLRDNGPMRLQKTRIHTLIRRGLLYSLLLAVAILGLGGVGFWMIDPRIDNLGDGLWLAFTTAATVGYGDVIPHTPASRIFSVVVVLLGLAVLSLVTASLSAIFVEKEVEAEERQIEKDLRRELRALREELHSLREEVRELRAPSQRSP